MSDALMLALIGLFGGVLLGLAARLGRFCTLGAIEDQQYQNDTTRLRMWALAIGVAGCASFGLAAFDMLDMSQTIYHIAPFSPVTTALGGLMFGYGMALAGNCGFGALARVGGGDMRSFVVVLVMGIAAYIMLSGPLAALRLNLINTTTLDLPIRDYASAASQLTGLTATTSGLIICAAIALCALAKRSFAANPNAVLWATVVGLAIASGWAGTYWVAQNGFSATTAVSHTFTAPLGETMLFLMTSSGGGLGFSIGSVFGVLLGALIGSLIKGHFRWEACEDPRELKRQILGAVLMGFGAVLALGCTIGQGISAFSVLSLGAPLALLGIYTGATLGLRQLIVGFAR